MNAKTTGNQIPVPEATGETAAGCSNCQVRLEGVWREQGVEGWKGFETMAEGARGGRGERVPFR